MVYLPKEASANLGRRGRVPVVGTINGFPIRTSVFPTEGGRHCLMVNKAMQTGAGVVPGNHVTVVLERDVKPRRVVVPKDLRAAIAEDPAVSKTFDALPYSHKREYVEWIDNAKRPETRARRISETIARLKAGKKRLK